MTVKFDEEKKYSTIPANPEKKEPASRSPKNKTHNGTKTVRSETKMQAKKMHENFGRGKKIGLTGKFSSPRIFTDDAARGRNRIDAGGNAEKKSRRSVEFFKSKKRLKTKKSRTTNATKKNDAHKKNGFVFMQKKYLFKIDFTFFLRKFL
jgi:hypothetical protein